MLKGKPTASMGSIRMPAAHQSGVFIALWSNVGEEDNMHVWINQWEVVAFSVIISAIKSVVLSSQFPVS